MTREQVILTLASGPHIEQLRTDEGLTGEHLLDLARTVVDTALTADVGMTLDEIDRMPHVACRRVRAVWASLPGAQREGACSR